MKTTELLIPLWPNNPTAYGKIGTTDYGDPCCSVDSLYLPMRAIPTSDSIYQHAYNYRVWQDISLHMFVHRDGSIDIGVRAHDVHGADISEVEIMIRKMKWAAKHLPKTEEWKVESIQVHLTELFTRLGIKRCVLYGGQDNVYAPIIKATTTISQEINRRHSRLQRIAT